MLCCILYVFPNNAFLKSNNTNSEINKYLTKLFTENSNVF